MKLFETETLLKVKGGAIDNTPKQHMKTWIFLNKPG